MHKEVQGTADAGAAVVGEKAVWFGERTERTLQYERGKLRPGHQFGGPAIVFQYDTTTVIPPGWAANVDEYGNLILSRSS